MVPPQGQLEALVLTPALALVLAEVGQGTFQRPSPTSSCDMLRTAASLPAYLFQAYDGAVPARAGMERSALALALAH
jgi:hypothetical protein